MVKLGFQRNEKYVTFGLFIVKRLLFWKILSLSMLLLSSWSCLALALGLSLLNIATLKTTWNNRSSILSSFHYWISWIIGKAVRYCVVSMNIGSDIYIFLKDSILCWMERSPSCCCVGSTRPSWPGDHISRLWRWSSSSCLARTPPC